MSSTNLKEFILVYMARFKSTEQNKRYSLKTYSRVNGGF